MDDTLRQCPFCGSKKIEYTHCNMSGEHHFNCDGCGALVLFPVDLTEDEARQRWNTRWWLHNPGTQVVIADVTPEAGWMGNINGLGCDPDTV